MFTLRGMGWNPVCCTIPSLCTSTLAVKNPPAWPRPPPHPLGNPRTPHQSQMDHGTEEPYRCSVEENRTLRCYRASDHWSTQLFLWTRTCCTDQGGSFRGWGFIFKHTVDDRKGQCHVQAVLWSRSLFDRLWVFIHRLPAPAPAPIKVGF